MLTRIQIHPGNIHRSQVTRTFHNGTLRASRTWRGVSIRSRGHNSEPISQRLTEYFIAVDRVVQQYSVHRVYYSRCHILPKLIWYLRQFLTLPVSLGRLQFPSLDYDFIVHMFSESESQNGDQREKKKVSIL
uniref:Uncharacterized protein n=1 Tax=Wuchereria bancrofti TaxID=6293 RepID=A0A1I8EN63_WUCBA